MATGSLSDSFRCFDTDGSGTLTADECVAILTRQAGGKPLSLADAQAFVQAFDGNGDGVLDYLEFCAALGAPQMAQPVQDQMGTTITTMTWYVQTTVTICSFAPLAVPIAGTGVDAIQRILGGEAWAAVEAAQAMDGATLWAVFKKHKALVKAGEVDEMEMFEWIGAVEHNVGRTMWDALCVEDDVDDDRLHLLIIFEHSVRRFWDSTGTLSLLASERLCDATKVELFHKWAARADYLPTARMEDALPVLARIAQHAGGESGGGVTALGYFGEHDLRTVACTCLYHLRDADDRNDLVEKADSLGLVDATIALAASLLAAEDKPMLFQCGLSQTILDVVRRPDGFEERILAALGVEDLQMGLLPDDYWS